MKILVVEDDQTVARTLQILLTDCNYAVDLAADGEAGLQMADAFDYDLLLLDIVLPKLDGVNLCQQLRAKKFQKPILLLTGQGEGRQKAVALNAGADDYVVKPFDPEELVARIQALLRRGGSTTQPILSWGRLSLDPNSRKVTYGTHIVAVTAKEYAILELFLRNPHKIFSTSAILDQVWNSVEASSEAAVRGHIKELRQKLKGTGAPKDLIKTVFQAGYRLNPLYSSVLAEQVEQQPTISQVAELVSVNEELRVTLDELQVTEEELRQQNEELAAARYAIEQERQRYQELFEFAPDGYVVTDQYGTIQKVNRTAAAMLGVDSNFLSNKPLITFIALSDRSAFRTQLANLDSRENWEVILQDRRGDSFPVLITVTTIRDAQNQLTGLRWSLRDIRQRKQMEQQLQAAHDQLEVRVAERTAELIRANVDLQQQQEQRQQAVTALQESESHYRLMFESNPNPMWLYDPETLAFLEVNQAATEQYGYSRAEFLQRTIADIRPPDDVPTLHQVNNYLIPKQPHVGVWRHCKKDGSIMDVEVTTYALLVADKQTNLALIKDITELKYIEAERQQAEVALRQSEEKYRSLFNQMDEGFCIIELIFDETEQPIDYRFLEINPSFEYQTGLTNAQGKTARELAPNLEAHWFQTYGKVALTGEPVRFVNRAEEMGRWFDVYAFRLGAPASRQVALLFQDITDRKQAEEILQRTAELNAFRISLADALRPLTDASEIQAIAARILGEALRATRVIYIEVVSGGEAVIVHRNYTNGVAELSGQYRLEDYHRNLVADHQAGHPQVVTDIPNNPKYTDAEKARYRELDIAAHIDVPLIKKNQFVALLAVHQSTPRQWNETEVKLVEETAERTWVAIERVCAEAALRENEQLLRLAMASAQAGSWNWELATGKLTWSPEMYALHGLDPTADLPDYEGWYDNLLHPDDRTWVNDYVSQILGQRLPEIQLEFRIVHAQRGIRWLLSLGRLILNEQGEPIRLSGINLDITDRKQAEQTIREQATLLDIASDAISVCDLDHRILYWNQGAERLYGWTATEAIGQSVNELLQSDTAQVSAGMQMLLEQGEWRSEIRKVTKIGRGVIVEVGWTLVRDEVGQPKCILSVETDITEKKQLEAQFYRAQRLESIGTLASGIAHDLNNVFTPIMALSQLLQLKLQNLDARSREMVEVLSDSAERGASLVRQILAFARGTEGKRIPLQVGHLLHEIADVAQQTFPKSIAIRRDIPSLWLVSADSTHLHQVLMNLCVNARDAMPNGGVLSLTAHNQFVDAASARMHVDAKEGNYVMITITDTGTGIAPELLDRIFDPFFTTKEPGEGTGLGLSTVLGIVKNYGGFVQVTSEVGQGTRFQIYLPAISEAILELAEENIALQGERHVILIVDDEIAVQQANQALLESYNFRTMMARDGLEAIEVYREHQQEIDAVLIDIMMPNMGGASAIRRLRRISSQVKIIAISGLPSNRQPAMQAGANLFLSKPYTPQALLMAMQELMDRQS